MYMGSMLIDNFLCCESVGISLCMIFLHLIEESSRRFAKKSCLAHAINHEKVLKVID
jgi:hypothetical protein